MNIKWFKRLLIFGILTTLLYFALRDAPLAEILHTLQQLRLSQIAALVAINFVIYLLITLRWWIIVQAENKQVIYLPLILIRVAVFGVSYFTLGPQVGGEPLQVLYLQRAHQMTYTRATSTVIMDKLLEFLANFFLLAFGLSAVLQAGILSVDGNSPNVGLIAVVILFLWSPLHIFLLYRKKYPISALLRLFANNRFARFVSAVERMAGTFCRRHLEALAYAMTVSFVAAIGMVCEYFLIISFLHIPLFFSQTIAAWTAGWLAFLVPIPGGLGALEASQVFALGAFGVSASSAISVTLLIRARDLLIGGLGILFAGHGVAK